MDIATPIVNKKKAFITGVNGLLGQKLVEKLAARGTFEIVGCGKGPSRLSHQTFEYVTLDITNESKVKTEIARVQPDVVFHCAAMTNVDECETNQEAAYEINVLATKYLLEASEKAGSHFIFVSTDFIFSGDEGPLDEEAIPSPVNYYGETKLEAEKMVQASTTKWSIARTVLVFGIAHDMSRTNIILWVKSSLESGKNIKIVDDQFRTPTLAEDLAEGCILIAEKEAEGIFNISGSDFLSAYDMAIITADFFKLDKSLITKVDSTIFTPPAKRPLITGLNIEKARKELGFEPKTFQTAIEILSKQIILASS